MTRPSLLRTLLATALSASALTAHAHTGHDTSSLFSGVLHPIGGADHLLAMLAVGLWSVSTLPRRQAWHGPLAFLLALLLGGLLGLSGLGLPGLEHAIALSVAVFGGMLMWPRQALEPRLGLALVAIGGLLHGWAHGSEAPLADAQAYVLGFVFSSGLLHLCGMGLGQALHRWHGRYQLHRLLGSALAASGVFLLSQI